MTVVLLGVLPAGVVCLMGALLAFALIALLRFIHRTMDLRVLIDRFRLIVSSQSVCMICHPVRSSQGWARDPGSRAPPTYHSVSSRERFDGFDDPAMR